MGGTASVIFVRKNLKSLWFYYKYQSFKKLKCIQQYGFTYEYRAKQTV